MVVVGTLVIMNGAPVQANLFGAQLSMTMGTGMLVAYLLACLAFGGAACLLKREKVVQDKTLAEWNTQDQKLMQSVQTDREKQLEAKIETLESALKQALKRGASS
jgi:hypothetical protein